MKVTKSMIAPDLRFLGMLYRLLPKSVLMKEKNMGQQKNVKHGKNEGKSGFSVKMPDKLGNVRNIYVKRADESLLRLMITKPKHNIGSRVGVLWIHGGGYVTGAPEMAFMSMARQIAKECIVVSPAYRLSSAEPYPAALDDCYQALLWMKENAGKLGISENRIFVGGESAGGGLTVALCLLARDRGEVKIACQMPLYPMIDDSMQGDSMKDNNAPVWNEQNNRKAWELYLRGQDRGNPPSYAAPARETDYHNLPPAITFVGDIEPFCDETRTYVENLKKCGIPVAFRVYKGCYHAFDMMVPWSKEAQQARAFFMHHFHLAIGKSAGRKSKSRTGFIKG